MLLHFDVEFPVVIYFTAAVTLSLKTWFLNRTLSDLKYKHTESITLNNLLLIAVFLVCISALK